MGKNSMSSLGAIPGDESKILDSSHSYDLDSEHYMAYKVVFDANANIKIFPATEESRKELKEQPRDQSDDYLINKYWEVQYEKDPWLQADNFLANEWVSIKKGINNIRFATQVFGEWNLLNRDDRDSCQANPCDKFNRCICQGVFR